MPLIKIAKTTGALKTEIIATQEVTKALEGTAEMTKKSVEVAKEVIKKVKQVQRPIAIATALSEEKDKPMKDMTADELFAKMFGTKASSQAVSDLVVPLIINKKYGRKTKLNIIAGKTYVVSEDLEISLEEFLKKEIMSKIFDPQNITSNGIALETLEQFGIAAYFDETDVAVKINIAPSNVIQHNIVLSPMRQNADRTFKKILMSSSKPISGASNFYIRDSASSSSQDKTINRTATQIRNRTYVNVNDFIVETGAIITEPMESSSAIRTVNRDYSYVSKDFPEHNQRIKLGDVALTGSDKMVSKNILGISLLKHHDITKRMHQSIRVSNKEIFLENESRLQIYINERLIRTIDLEPGAHSINDFPLTSGLNNIKIKITDILGNEKIIDYDEFSFTEMLRKDASTYGISVGIDSTKIGDGSIEYDTNKPILSAYYNYGLNDYFTIKTGLQMNDMILAYGGELLFGSNWGLLSVYGVLSETQDYGQGRKYGFAYKHNIGKNAINIQKETIDDTYKDISIDTTLNRAQNSVMASFSRQVFSSGYLSLNYRNMQALNTDTQTYGISYTQNLAQGWDIRTSVNQIYNNNVESIQANCMLSFRPSSSRMSYQSTLTYADQSLAKKIEADMGRDGRYGLNAVYSYLENGSGQVTNNIRTNYTDSSYILQADYTDTGNNEGTLSQQGAVSLATGIAFVGTQVSMTQPISNSFVLVKNDERLSKDPLGVVSYNENNPSKSFVMPLGDYATRKLKISDKNLIFGAELVENEYDIATKYKSGLLVEITPKFILSAKGVIYNNRHEVLAQKVFKLYKVSEEGTLKEVGEEDIFFTNAKGKFILGSIEEGRYMAKEINVDDPYSFEFVIKSGEEETGFIDLGELTVVSIQNEAKPPGG